MILEVISYENIRSYWVQMSDKIMSLMNVIKTEIPRRKWFGKLILTFHEGQLRTVEQDSKAMSVEDIISLFDMEDIIKKIKCS